METRANHLWVGAVTLVLLAALAFFFVWLARLGQGSQNEYDIFFKQSVSGLANGSEVSFAGVPVGQVSQIALWERDPQFVRVRVRVRDEVPILVGTTATIQGSFTGVSTILLDGARKGAPPISCETTSCVSDVPQIPTKPGGLGELLANAPLLLERLATLTDRLTQLLSPRNQEEIEGILGNTNRLLGNADRLTAELADDAPQVERTLVELEGTLREASEALDAFEAITRSSDKLINEEGQSLATQLRGTLESASEAADALSNTLEQAQPVTQQLTQSTLPAAEATLADLKATSEALRAVTEQLENDGAASLLGGPELPEYEP